VRRVTTVTLPPPPPLSGGSAQAEIAIDAQAGFIKVLQSQIVELMERIDTGEGGGDGSGVAGSPFMGGSDDGDALESSLELTAAVGTGTAPATPPTRGAGDGGGGVGSGTAAVAVTAATAATAAAGGDGSRAAVSDEGGWGAASPGIGGAARDVPGGVTATPGAQLNGHVPESRAAPPPPLALEAGKGIVAPPLGLALPLAARMVPSPQTNVEGAGVGVLTAHKAASLSGSVPGSGMPNSARDSARGSRRGSTAAMALDIAAVAQLMELSSLREEVAELRKARAGDLEELAAREEEVASLTSLLNSRQSQLEAFQATKEVELRRARDAGFASAMERALEELRRFTCGSCHTAPFADLLDVTGVAALHSHVCFEAEQARAALARVEDRAAVLQAEVDDLKTFIATHGQGGGGGRPPSGSISSAAGAAASARSEESHATGRTAVAVPLPAAEVVKRDVVDVKVMTDLQHKLTSLIQVHRQLLRKYAVVDVECGEMAEGLKARDERIADLVKASLAHNAAMNTLREQYEDEMEGMRREYVDQLRQLRSELLSLHASGPAGSGNSSSGASSSARPSARAGAGGGATITTATSARAAAQAVGDDAGGAAAGVSSGMAALRTRHIVKPLRGHTVTTAASGAATYRLGLPGSSGPGSLPGVSEEDTDRSADDTAADAASQTPGGGGSGGGASGSGGGGGGSSRHGGDGGQISLPSSRLQALFATSSAMAAGQPVR